MSQANSSHSPRRGLWSRVTWFDRIAGAGGLLAAAGAVVCAPFVSDSTGAINDLWFGGAIASALTAAGFPLAATWRAKRAEVVAEEREIEARTQARLEMNTALDPIVRTLGASASQDVAGLRDKVRWLVVKTAAEIIGPDQGTRSCYFDLEAGPPKTLVPTEFYAGRIGTTRSTFVQGTEDGDAAIAMVETGGHLHCEDTDKDPPPGWNNRTRDYKTFVSVAVVAGTTAYGMLTVDALNPRDLDQRDVDLLTVMAGLVAIAMGMEQ